ncbi:MAG: hypothetical protein S0880_37025 [Actinomycetota bacterium]|nr:hypothetical protein [Actinomycetota bacterium]
MGLVCLVSAKGSPGVTTTALGLAAAATLDTAHRKLLLEADPSGGSLAVRFHLGRQPGLVTLAAAGRHGLARDDLWRHAQELPGGLPVVVAPERPDRATSVLEASGARLGRWLAERPDVTTVADCGRLASTGAGLAGEADLVVMVARSVAEQIHPGAALLDQLAAAHRPAAWLLIGTTPHSADEVERVTGHPVLRALPDDPRAAAALSAGDISTRLARRPLLREIATLATDIAAVVGPTATVEPAPTPGIGAESALSNLEAV